MAFKKRPVRRKKANPFRTAKLKRKKKKSPSNGLQGLKGLKRTSKRSGEVMREVGLMLSKPKKVRVIEPRRERIGRFAK